MWGLREKRSNLGWRTEDLKIPNPDLLTVYIILTYLLVIVHT